jgi:hypothetical protein
MSVTYLFIRFHMDYSSLERFFQFYQFHFLYMLLGLCLFLLVGLGFTLRTSHVQSKHSTTWGTSPDPMLCFGTCHKLQQSIEVVYAHLHIPNTMWPIVVTHVCAEFVNNDWVSLSGTMVHTNRYKAWPQGFLGPVSNTCKWAHDYMT